MCVSRAKIMLSIDSEEWHSCLETFMSKDPAMERQERVLVNFHYFHLSCFTIQLHCFAFLQFLWATMLSSILFYPKFPKKKVRNRKYNISHDRDRSLKILPLFWVKKKKIGIFRHHVPILRQFSNGVANPVAARW